MGLDITFLHKKTNKELYFRKVPRIVIGVTYAIAKDKEYDTQLALEQAHSISGPDKPKWIRVGTTTFKVIKEGFWNATDDSENGELFWGYKGFFWGEDRWTGDFRIQELFSNWINKIEKSGEKLQDDDEVEYYFSW